MKKITFLTACVLALAVMGGCKQHKAKSAGETAKAMHECLKDANYDVYVESVVLTPSILTPDEKTQHAQVLKKNVEPKIQSKGGIKSVDVKSEQVAPDGKTADVVLNTTYNNGDTEDVYYAMILDEQDWKVRLGNDKEVWTSHTPDGKREVVKLKETNDKAFEKDIIEGERGFIKEKDSAGREVTKVKEGGEKDVLKVKEKADETVVKEKVDGKKEVVRVPNE